MELSTTAKLRVGEWCVDTVLGEMTRDDKTVRLEPRTLRLLLCLAERAGQIVSADDLLLHVWSGVVVTPDSVYQAIASLRKLLGDDPKQPAYIVTMPRQGYRMVAPVGPWTSEAAPAPDAAVVAPSGKTSAEASRKVTRKASRSRVAAMAVACIVAAFGIGLWLQNSFANGHGTFPSAAAGPGPAAQYRNSIAVLPFLDLTEEMGREIFADGMAEELIDRLSRIPGYKVPSPASSFYFKGKHVPVADIGKQLGVNYVLSGSVRSSGTTLRVAARLIQADNGFIIWSETYDRPVDDLLKVQEDIAGAVANALKGMIEGSAPHPKSS